MLYFMGMKTKLHHILIAAAMMLILGMAPISAAQEAPSEHELAVIDLVNQARRAPLAMAESLGLDPGKILEDLPELSELLENGMLPVRPDQRLFDSAAAHAEDMLERNYHDKTTPEGLTHEERIIATGYTPTVAGEAIGMRGFVNFIPQEKAARKMFEKMFEDELDPTWTGERVILNPDLRDMGVGLAAGVYSVSDVPWNVYMIVCDFGTNEEERMVERILMSRINQVRLNPTVTLEELGIDPGATAEALGEDAWVLNFGLPPLAWHDRLHLAALAHNLDMLERLYFDETSPDGVEPLDRAEAAGHDAIESAETLAAHVEIPGDPWTIAEALFAAAVERELTVLSRDRTIFNPDLTELGVACTFTGLEPGRADGPALHLMVVDAAKPAEPRSFAMGQVFMDRNGDQLIDPGEEAGGLRISLRNYYARDEIVAETVTGLMGEWQLELSIFQPYILKVFDADDVLLYEHAIADAGENFRHNIPISP